MTATDELDESIVCTQWEACGFLWDADDREERIYLSADRLITPEQVIAATLGPRSDSCNCTNGERTNLAVTLGDTDATQARQDVVADVDEIIEHVINGNMLSMPYDVYVELFDAVDGLGVKIENLQSENAKLRELVRDYERCSVHADCAECEYDGKLSTHCPLGPCFPDIDELRELGPWKELPHGGVVTESSIRPSEEGSVCPAPRASVTFEGQKFTFDAEDSKRFAKLLEGHLRKIAGVEVDE